MCIDGARQFERMFVGLTLRIDDVGMGTALGIDERGVGLALHTQTLHINLGRLQLRLERVALTLGQQSAVLEYHGIATIDDILR